MAVYELMYILRPDLEEEQQAQELERVQDVITRGQGSIEKVDKWGRRKLSYLVNGQSEGFYVVTTFQGPPELPGELTRVLGIQENVLRSMITGGND